jgi:histidinol-phosphate aminotransferase
LANALRLITSTFNISAFAEIGALAALDDAEYKDFIMDSNATERQRIIDGLKELGCKPMQSVTNFVAAETGAPGEKVVAAMRARGIRIGRLADSGFETYVRISMGQPNDTVACLGALKEVLEELRN